MTTTLPLDERPIMLWCSSHSTLAAEEIPLFLAAGFRVIPLLTDFWTFEYAPSLDSKICQEWKASIGLPQEIVQRLQALKFCENSGQNNLLPSDIQLLNDYVDVVYLTVLPNLAIQLANAIKGTVLFRPFGHGHLNNYSAIARHLNADLATLANCPNYMWVPILTTLQWPEDPRLCVNAQHLGAFVTLSRLGKAHWAADRSEPYVVETIPRIEKQLYYLEIYKQYRADHGELPIKILGGNTLKGGELNDPAILGFLDDVDYYRIAANARVSIYHGRSPFHVHYHPIEFMSLGVPVLFHQTSAFAAEGKHFGLSDSQLVEAGMYASSGEANEMARAAFADQSLAEQWSRKQRFFLDEVFNRKKALDQARWIKSRVLQLKNWPDKITPSFRSGSTIKKESVPGKRRIGERVLRELQRVLRKTKLVSQHSKSA